MLLLSIVCLTFNGFAGEDDDNSPLDFSIEGMGTISLNSHPDGLIPFYGLGVYPRFNFYSPIDYFSVSVGTPLNAGLDAAASSSGTFLSIFTDVPLELAANFGDRATSISEYYFGGYVGVGLNYNFSYFVNPFGTSIKAHTFGPSASIGFRFNFRDNPAGVRASFMYGVVNNFEEDPFIVYTKTGF